MSELEQNKRINQLRRQLANAVQRIKTLELDVEPEGRISQAFSVMEKHIDQQFAQVNRQFEQVNQQFDQVNRRLDRFEHQFNQLNAKIEVILETMTGLGDLPEDETE